MKKKKKKKKKKKNSKTRRGKVETNAFGIFGEER